MSDDKPMGRRQFFSLGLGNVARAGAEALEEKVRVKARHYIRPPFAAAELDFLLNCTRCGDCIAACPHQVVFALSGARGVEVAGTPALDLLHKGCHLCADWPCVVACGEQALVFPVAAEDAGDDRAVAAEDQQRQREPALPEAADCPTLASFEIDVTTCLPYVGPECGACRGSCPVEGALVWRGEKPQIVARECVGCGLCREACITEPKSVSVRAL